MNNIISQIKAEEEKSARLYSETEQKLKALLEQKKSEMEQIVASARQKSFEILLEAKVEGEKKALAELETEEKEVGVQMTLLEDRFSKYSEKIAEEILEDFVSWPQSQ